MASKRLALRYIESDAKGRVRLILRALDPDNADISAQAKNMLLAEAIKDWIEGGNKKMGEIIVARIVPQQTEHKRTNDMGDNALEAVRAMSGGQKQKLLEEAMNRRSNSPVKADFEVTE